MSYHKLLSKCDQAIAAFLISEGVGTSSDIFPAKNAATLPNPPFIAILSDGAIENVHGSSNYTVKVTAEVHTNAAPDVGQDTDQMKLDSDDFTAACIDALKNADDSASLADAITLAANGAGVELTVQDVRDAGVGQGRSDRDGEWIDTINLELVCYPS